MHSSCSCIICNNLIGEYNLRRGYLKPKTYSFQDKKGILMSCICKFLHFKFASTCIIGVYVTVDL
jgi:hypothetical protein